jgi:putative DNA primase/helicase
MQNIQETVRNVMRDNGITPPETIILDGVLHRFKDESGKLNCWYTAHSDGRAAGTVGNWKTGLKVNWKAEGNYSKLTDAQLLDFHIEKHRQELIRKHEEKARHQEAMTKATYIWSQATLAPINHPYLVKKHIGIHGARLGRDNTLIIPLYNTNKDIINLQFISETGGKRFLSGGQKKGCFYILEGVKDKIIICEGFATAASLYENSGYLTVVAFDAGNLKNVAINIKSLYPASKIVIAGDNDLSGIGQKKAIEAALAVNGEYLVPATVGHDWNDSLTVEVTHA